MAQNTFLGGLVLDWLTMILPLSNVSPVVAGALRDYRERSGSQVLKIEPGGVVAWRTWQRQSIRSDSHALTVFVGERLELYGSPARSMGLSDNVFGSDDLRLCAEAHVALAESVMGVALPRVGWHLSRLDVTHNYDLGGPSAVRQALAVLRHASGGRYALRDSGDTIYWGRRGSGGRMGKAYHKGPHLLRQVSRGEAVASGDRVAAAMALLRLELTLGRVALRRLGWLDPFGCSVSVEGLLFEHEKFFSGLIGGCEVVSMDTLFERVVGVAPTPGQGRAALATLGRVRIEGVEVVKASIPARTWHRHKNILFAAGLSWSDLASGSVVPLRRVPLVLGAPVVSWESLLSRVA